MTRRFLNLAAALLLFSTRLHIGVGSTTTREEARECSQKWPCPANNFPDAVNNQYSLKLSSAVYHPGQVINGKQNSLCCMLRNSNLICDDTINVHNGGVCRPPGNLESEILLKSMLMFSL